jgi:hypothetical protein
MASITKQKTNRKTETIKSTAVQWRDMCIAAHLYSVQPAIQTQFKGTK